MKKKKEIVYMICKVGKKCEKNLKKCGIKCGHMKNHVHNHGCENACFIAAGILGESTCTKLKIKF